MDEASITALLDRLTLEEQVALLAGETVWTTPAIPRLGVPPLKVTDGPNGARGGGSLVGGVRSASFPVGIALGATWDTGLVAEIGRALGREARSKGARVLLAPTVNIHRSPLNGRNFECYSEDPLLTARLACAYIAGVQGEGVAATIKHFVGNESEFERTTIDSVIAERPLREIYLLPFELSVKEARVWAVMASYNRLNGIYTGESPRLLRDILKGEWGFDGVAMSDWFATHSTGAAIDAGLDLEMPGPPRWRGARLVEAVHAGEADADAVRDSAGRMLRLLDRVGAFADPTIPEEQAIDRPEDRALIRRAGAAGTVLLKNDGILPLDPQEGGTVAIIGPNARTAQIMGGGSAQLNAHYRISPWEGIAAQAGTDMTLRDALGCTNYKLLPLLDSAIGVEYFTTPDLSGSPALTEQVAGSEIMWLGVVRPGIDPTRFFARLTTTFTPDEDGEYTFGLVSAGRSRLALDGEPLLDNWTDWAAGDNYFGAGSAEMRAVAPLRAKQAYSLTVEYAYATEGALGIRALRLGVARLADEETIAEAVALAAEASTAILCVGANGDWDTEGRDRTTLTLPGRQDELIARVCAVNPCTIVVVQTGAPLAMPWLGEAAAIMQAWYPGQECGNAIADVLFGAVEPGGRLPQTFPARLRDNPAFLNYPGENGVVRYGEGLFVGYRYYEAKGIAPLFPFGYGLSYTTFAYGPLALSAATLDTEATDGTIVAQIAVTNTGQRTGQEVVQGYVHDHDARLARPEKELKAFAKLTIAPGETATATLTLDLRALAYFDDAQGAWVAEAGDFTLLVGRSSAEIVARATFALPQTVVLPA